MNVCCKRLRSGDASPFEILMLGWQDGLTGGMAHCVSCGATYHFEMVSWDADQEVRVYGFREVSRPSYDEIMALHSLPLPAARDAWERGAAIVLKTRDALATSFERTLYVAATDLAKKIIAARQVDFALWKEVLAL